jgi:hypothetical protein
MAKGFEVCAPPTAKSTRTYSFFEFKTKVFIFTKVAHPDNRCTFPTVYLSNDNWSFDLKRPRDKVNLLVHRSILEAYQGPASAATSPTVSRPIHSLTYARSAHHWSVVANHAVIGILKPVSNAVRQNGSTIVNLTFKNGGTSRLRHGSR